MASGKSQQFIDKVVTLLGQTKGRDKVMRVIQYFAMTLVGYYPIADLSKKLAKIGAHLSLVRRVLRLGGPISVVTTIQRRSLDQIADVLKSIGELGGLLYLLIDAYAYICQIGVLSHTASPRLVAISNLGWIWDSTFTVIHNLIVYSQLCQKEGTEERRTVVVADTARALGDIPCGVYFIDNTFMEKGTCGLLGLGTSVLGLFLAWKSL